MLSDLQNLSNDVETLKTENEQLQKQLKEETEKSDQIIEVKDNQIQQLKNNNADLVRKIDQYEANEKYKIKELRDQHLQLQVEFEKVCTELESRDEEEKDKLQQ